MNPDVIDGYRSTRDERDKQATASKRQAGRAIPDGKVVFQSRGGRYRLQLTAPDEEKQSDGRLRRKRAVVAQFDEFFLVLDEKKEAEKIGMIREHADYGIDFWDFADTLRQVQERRVEDAVKTFASVDPESRKAILAALAASNDESFEVPEGKSDKQTVKK